MKLLVISMMNENGKKRRSYLNYDYKLIEGSIGNNLNDKWVKEVSKKIKLKYNAKQSTIDGFTGNFASHLKALDYIIKNKLNDVIILEDDSIQTNPITKKVKKELKSLNEVALLSGQINHPSSWNKDIGWKKEGKNKQIINNFKEGINDIDYKKFRWTQINAMYVPTWKVAKKLLEEIRSKEKYIGFDYFLSKHRLVNKLIYPAIFKHHDHTSKSQVASNPGIVIDYVKV